jgi:sterol 3beta-glucosyltransferase
MKLFIATIGSRGDNEPFKALALEAASAGHEVHFAHTTDLPTESQAPYHELPLRGSFESFIADQGISVWKALRSYRTTMKPLLEAAYEDVNEHIQRLEPDVVVYHPKLVTAPVVAHQVGAIAVIAEMFPTLTPTTEFAAAGLPAGLPGWLNTLSFRLVQAGLRAMGAPAEKLAKKLGVVNITPDLTLCPVSPTLVPKPKDWPEWACVTGHWSTPVEGELDQELEEFLSSGPVVYAGFGSMKDSLATKRAEGIVSGAKQAGFKVLLVTGWGGLAPSLAHVEDPDVLVRGSVPHSLVFPRVTVIMHHGGAGTTHQAVASGVVSVIMPFLADQPWWANRLHRLGLGPKPLSRTTTNPRVIAKTLLGALDYSGAVELAAQNMAVDNGLGDALTLLEEAERGQLPLRPS